MLGPKPLGWSLTLMFPGMALWIGLMIVAGMFDAETTSEQIKALSKDGMATLPSLLLLVGSITWVVASVGLISWARGLSGEDRLGLSTFGLVFVLVGITASIVSNGMFFVAGEAAAAGETTLAATALELWGAVDWWGSITWILGAFLIAVTALQQKAANTIIVALMALGAAVGFIAQFPGLEELGLAGYPMTGLAISALGIQKLRA